MSGQETQVPIEKLNKSELLDYTSKLIVSYNELNSNYTVLYNEYQRVLSLSQSNSEQVDVNKINELQNDLSIAQAKLDELECIVKDYEEAKLNQEVIPNTEIKDFEEKIASLTEENKALNDELINIKLEHSKGSSLKNINMMDKSPDVTRNFQIYEIKAHENRVDNSEQYAGREFVIAKISVQLNDKTFIWTVDFIGSDLFKAEKFTRTVTMTEEQYEYFDKLTNVNTMFKSIKYMLDIPDKFNADIWFDSILYKYGNVVNV